MFARLYLILGSLLLLGYCLVFYEAWELGNPVRLAAAPAVGSSLSSSSGGSGGGHYSSSSSSGRGVGVGVGGFGGK
jgi:hypothetical protein